MSCNVLKAFHHGMGLYYETQWPYMHGVAADYKSGGGTGSGLGLYCLHLTQNLTSISPI